MITLKTNEGTITHDFELSTYPDGTSQVWKLTPEPEEGIDAEVIWKFEDESELISVMQLGHLLKEEFKCKRVELNCPWLPYGRQDKRMDNLKTFGKKTFLKALKPFYDAVVTIDVHSGKYNAEEEGRLGVGNIRITSFIKSIVPYKSVVAVSNKRVASMHSLFTAIYYDNNKQPSNPLNIELKDSNVFLITDICDAGYDVIEIAKDLKQNHGVKRVELYATHGVFSRGIKYVLDEGIDMIHTTNTIIGKHQEPYDATKVKIYELNHDGVYNKPEEETEDVV